jgi:uncharacterized protein (DUF2267 family)
VETQKKEEYANMNELVKKVTDRVGLSADQAQKAIEVVVNFLEERLPAPIAGQLDNVLGQGGSVTEAAKGLTSKLGL